MDFTIEAMRLPIEALGYELFGELAVMVIFDRGKVQEEDEVLTKAMALGNWLADSRKGVLL